MYDEDRMNLQRGYFYTSVSDTIRGVFADLREQHFSTCDEVSKEHDEENDIEGCSHTLPEPIWNWVICSDCRGDGGRALGGAIVSGEALRDSEFMEGYMNGRYDTTCEDCKGSGKVREASYEHLDESIQKLIRRALRDNNMANAESLMERRAGA